MLLLKYSDKLPILDVKPMAELFTATNNVPDKTVPSNKFKNRNRMEIVANLLSIAKNGALKTHLMYKANLSYLMVTEYLDFLIRSSLIKETIDSEGTGKLFQTTEKGLKYLEVYDSLQAIVGLDANKIGSRSDIFA
jgi:predicted transcriptional regulator